MKKIEDLVKYAIVIGTCLTVTNCSSDRPEGTRPVSIKEDGISNYIFYHSIFGNGYVPVDKEK